MATTNFKLPHIAQSQAQKEVTHNQALDQVDAILNALCVANPATMTATQTAGATYGTNEQAMINSLKADVVAVRQTLDALLTALKAKKG